MVLAKEQVKFLFSSDVARRFADLGPINSTGRGRGAMLTSPPLYKDSVLIGCWDRLFPQSDYRSDFGCIENSDSIRHTVTFYKTI